MGHFRKWQATRRESADLSEELSATFYGMDGPRPAPGFIYEGECYIEKRGEGQFYLLIGREDWFSDDLEHLERILFAWCVTEFCEDYGLTDERAIAFLCVLQRWMSLEQFAEMMKANADETCPDVCHSHDYCDANMAMHEALDGSTDVDAFNEVWNIARPYLRAD